MYRSNAFNTSDINWVTKHSKRFKDSCLVYLLQRPTHTSTWWRSEQPNKIRVLPVEAMPSVVKDLSDVPPMALREVDGISRTLKVDGQREPQAPWAAARFLSYVAEEEP